MNKMTVKRVSPITGEIKIKEFPITFNQARKWLSGELIQNAMPHLSPEDREFIISGMSKEDWEHIFGNEEIEE